MSSTVQLIRSSELARSVEYAYAATAPSSARLVFLAGACPLDGEGRTVAVGDYRLQARRCIETMSQALADAGASLTDVVFTRVLVATTRRADLGAVWRVVREAFGTHDAPSTLLGVTVLGYEDQLVEIETVAAVVDPPV